MGRVCRVTGFSPGPGEPIDAGVGLLLIKGKALRVALDGDGTFAQVPFPARPIQ